MPDENEHERKRRQTNLVVYLLGACLYVGTTIGTHHITMHENKNKILEETTYYAKAKTTVATFRPFLDDMTIDDDEAAAILAVEAAHEKEKETGGLFSPRVRPDFTDILRDVNEIDRKLTPLEKVTYQTEYQQSLDDYLDEAKPTTRQADRAFTDKRLSKDTLGWLASVVLVPTLLTIGFVGLLRRPR